MGPGGRPGSGTVRSTTLETLGKQNRCQVGPEILFDHPGGLNPLGRKARLPDIGFQGVETTRRRWRGGRWACTSLRALSTPHFRALHG